MISLFAPRAEWLLREFVGRETGACRALQSLCGAVAKKHVQPVITCLIVRLPEPLRMYGGNAVLTGTLHLFLVELFVQHADAYQHAQCVNGNTFRWGCCKEGLLLSRLVHKHHIPINQEHSRHPRLRNCACLRTRRRLNVRIDARQKCSD
jgi:hypothetical protein